MTSGPEPTRARPTVLYNGSCPVCRAEIRHYQRLDEGRAALAFEDVSAPRAAPACGTDGEAMRRRLHVVDGDGRVLIGVDAFACIWARLPRYRGLARLVRLPVARRLAPLLYEPVALVLYRLDRRRRRRAGAALPEPS